MLADTESARTRKYLTVHSFCLLREATNTYLGNDNIVSKPLKIIRTLYIIMPHVANDPWGKVEDGRLDLSYH